MVPQSQPVHLSGERAHPSLRRQPDSSAHEIQGPFSTA